VRVLIGTMSIRLSKDNHDSWGTCTTSAECKIVITVVLTVMSSMDPHMISGNLGWVFLLSLGWVVIRLGFPIFQKVQITIDLGGFETHQSGFKYKEMNPATLAPRILWLSAELLLD
jgi:hypothetical protein